MQQGSKPLALSALFTGTLVWGLIWYPYRVLENAGLGGVAASVATYGVALAMGILAFPAHWRALRPTPVLILIALSVGACNIAYVLAMLHGPVMRVLLLFYLAPLWTVALSRLILGERLNRIGALVMLLSLGGAVVMLWRESGLPRPETGAEWLGLASGFLFALGNVLSRRASQVPEEARSLAMFLGVVAMGLLALPGESLPLPATLGGMELALILILGLVLLAGNVAAQYGFSHIPANRAAVILLLEPLVAAFAAWFLVGEAMGAREWLGGSLIAGASLLSGRLEEGAGEETVATKPREAPG